MRISTHLRFLRNEPAFCLIVVLLFALGIASTTLVLSAVEHFVLRPIDVVHPERLVRAAELEPNGLAFTELGYHLYDAAAHRLQSLDLVAADAPLDVAVSIGNGAPETAPARMVSGNYFELLGIRPVMGRSLVSADDSGDGTAIVLGFAFAQRHYGSSNPVGSKLFMDGVPFEVAGVMPRGFFGASIADPGELWIPIAAERRISPFPLDDPHSSRGFETLGRLKPGVPLARAQAEYAALFAELFLGQKEAPNNSPLHHGTVEPIVRRDAWNNQQIERVMFLLFAAVGVAFAIVCANVAGLFLARAARQQKEWSIRVSLGAGTWHLMRKRLFESGILTLLGAVAGLVLCYAGAPLLEAMLPVGRSPLPVSLRPDLRVIGGTTVLVGISILLVVMVSWRRGDRDIFATLRGGSATAKLGRLGRTLVVIQISLAVVLAFGAGLLIRTFHELKAADPGFDRDHLAIFSLDFQLAGLQAPPVSFANDLLGRVRAIGGIRSAALAVAPLMQGRGMKTSVAPADTPVTLADFLNTSTNAVASSYFDTLGIPLLSGRLFSDTNLPKPQAPGKTAARVVAAPVPVVVSAAFARFLFPNQPVLGKRFGVGIGNTAKPEYEIIGVVGDSKYRSLREIPPPTFYTPLESRLDTNSAILLYVRTAGDPHGVLTGVRQTLNKLAPELPFAKVDTMQEEIERSLWQERLLASLVAVFASLALLLAATGLYGLVAYELSRRMREMGVRIALGAQARHIADLIAREAGALMIAGAVAGVVASAALGGTVRSFLYGVPVWDPVSFLIALALTGASVAIACLRPTWRAMRVPPAVVLRDE